MERRAKRTRTQRDAGASSGSDAPSSALPATPTNRFKRVRSPFRPAPERPDQRNQQRHYGETSPAPVPGGIGILAAGPASRRTSGDVGSAMTAAVERSAPSDPIARQNLIIAHLSTPKDYTPHAAFDLSNRAQARIGAPVEAFAKIAGRDWSYFVKSTLVAIGRSNRLPDTVAARHLMASIARVEADMEEWGCHIDLGPPRAVSRNHAHIEFSPNDQSWSITCNSRNGLKLDDEQLRQAQSARLHSGICINIMGNQMLFLLANGESRYHPMLWRQVGLGTGREDAEHDDSDGVVQAHSRGPAHASAVVATPVRPRASEAGPSSSRTRSLRSRQRIPPPDSTPIQATAPSQPDRPEEKTSTKSQPRPSSRATRAHAPDERDWSLDQHKHEKPPFSYAFMIGQAVLQSPREKLTLASIYAWIKDHYAFYRESKGGWQVWLWRCNASS